MIKIKKFKKGFSILEVLVSSVIIITILSSLVFIGRTALSNSTYTQQRAQAIYISQEGIELVRQIRDSNWIDRDNTTNWDSFMVNADSSKTYALSYASPQYSLQVNNVNNDLDTVVVDGTSFKRTTKLEKIINTATILPSSSSSSINPTVNAAKVTVTVTWNYNGQVKSVQASEILTNWRPNY